MLATVFIAYCLWIPPLPIEWKMVEYVLNRMQVTDMILWSYFFIDDFVLLNFNLIIFKSVAQF